MFYARRIVTFVTNCRSGITVDLWARLPELLQYYMGGGLYYKIIEGKWIVKILVQL